MASLYAKARREPERSVRVVADDCAAGVHIHENVGVARKRGTEPPKSGAPCAVVLVFDLAVSGGVVGVLLLIVRLVVVRVCDIPENLVLREEEKVIRGRGDGARGRATPVIIRVLCNALERVTEFGGYSSHNAARGRRLARTTNIIPHVRVLPPAGVSSARVHAERRRGAGRVIGAVGKANVRPAGEGRLCKLEMDTARALAARIVVEADDKSISRIIRERKLPNCTVKRYLLTVSNTEITLAQVCT